MPDICCKRLYFQMCWYTYARRCTSIAQLFVLHIQNYIPYQLAHCSAYICILIVAWHSSTPTVIVSILRYVHTAIHFVFSTMSISITSGWKATLMSMNSFVSWLLSSAVLAILLLHVSFPLASMWSFHYLQSSFKTVKLCFIYMLAEVSGAYLNDWVVWHRAREDDRRRYCDVVFASLL